LTVAQHNENEVEVKFAIRDIGELTRALQEIGFTLKTPFTFESNTLYDNTGGDLRKAKQVLRLRIYGSRCVLTHKSRGNSGRHKSRTEHETKIDNAEELHHILTALGFQPSFRYEKFREEWTDGEGEVVIDRTPIGEIGEIEGSPEWIDRTARLLNVDESEYMTVSYAELFFRWKARTGSDAREMTFEECGTPKP
jgi:adenylate cyclase, class 2